MKRIPTITSDETLDAAIAEFEQLARAYRMKPASAEEHAWMLAYRDEIDRYEIAAGHEPDPPAGLSVLLEMEMTRRHLPAPALAALLGVNATRLSEVLRGKRKLNLDLARRLHQRLGIPADVLLNLPG